MEAYAQKERLNGQPLEVNLLDLALYIWSRKAWVAGITFVFAVLGALYAFTTKPVFQSDAVMAPKESSGGGQASLLSGLGGFGGMVAQRLGLGSNSVDQLEVLLTSRGLAEKVLKDHPDFMPRMFPGLWDPATGKWKASDPKEVPTLARAVDVLRQGYLQVVGESKRKLIYLTVYSGNRDFSREIATAFLDALNERMREDIRSDAGANRKYLEEQMIATMDPLIREKIQQLIAAEIEKSMMVSSRSFDVLEPPTLAEYATKPKKRKILMISLVAGFFFSFLALSAWKLGREAWTAHQLMAKGIR